MIALLHFDHGCAVRRYIDDELRFNLNIELFVDVMMCGLDAARRNIACLILQASFHASHCQKCFDAETRYRRLLERCYNRSIDESGYLSMERTNLFLPKEPPVPQFPLEGPWSGLPHLKLLPNLSVSSVSLAGQV